MDTDYLSTEAYNGILMEAERFDHDLTLHFGVLSYSCEDEAEYLDGAEELIAEIRELNTEELTDDIFFGNLPDVKALHLTLDRIIGNIAAVRKIPPENRQYEF